MSGEACGPVVRVCWYKAWYFIFAVLLLAYGVGTLFIPVAYPLDPAAEGAWYLPVGFSVVFATANILAAWGAKKIFQGPMAAREGDRAHYLEKMRNAFVAGFGFVAAFRIIALVMWVFQYT